MISISLIYALLLTIATLILLVAVLALILAFIAAFKIKLTLDTERQNINFSVVWLYPFLKATVEIIDETPVLTVYLFDIKAYRKPVKRSPKQKARKNNTGMIQLAHPTDVDIQASYSFRDPFETGIFSGILSAATQFMGLRNIEQHPDFMAQREYIYLDASAKVNAGTALYRLTRSKMIKH